MKSPLYHLSVTDGSGFWFLATPYKAHPLGLDAAFEHAARVACALEKMGINLFCPVVHFHPMSKHADQPDSFWAGKAITFLHESRGMIIARLPGWQSSKGIQYERSVIEATDRPVISISDPSK